MNVIFLKLSGTLFLSCSRIALRVSNQKIRIYISSSMNQCVIYNFFQFSASDNIITKAKAIFLLLSSFFFFLFCQPLTKAKTRDNLFLFSFFLLCILFWRKDFFFFRISTSNRIDISWQTIHLWHINSLYLIAHLNLYLYMINWN